MPDPIFGLGAVALAFLIANNVIRELRDRRARRTAIRR